MWMFSLVIIFLIQSFLRLFVLRNIRLKKFHFFCQISDQVLPEGFVRQINDNFFALRTNWIKNYSLQPAAQELCVETGPPGNASSDDACPVRSCSHRLSNLCASCFPCMPILYSRHFISQYELYTDFPDEIAIIFADMHKKQSFCIKFLHFPPNSVTLPKHAAHGSGNAKKKQAALFRGPPASLTVSDSLLSIDRLIYDSAKAANQPVNRIRFSSHQNTGSFF